MTVNDDGMRESLQLSSFHLFDPRSIGPAWALKTTDVASRASYPPSSTVQELRGATATSYRTPYV
jgi:hypothetical protein